MCRHLSPLRKGVFRASFVMFRNVITEQVNTFKKMDVGRALSQLRWLNFALGLIVIVFEVLSVISVIASFDLAAIILNAFCIIFCGILCLYELQMKRLGRKFRKLYGFLYTYIGRALYIFLYSVFCVHHLASEQSCCLLPATRTLWVSST